MVAIDVHKDLGPGLLISASVHLCVTKRYYFAFSGFKLCLILLLIFFNCSINAQDKTSSEVITAIAEQLAADESDPESVQIFTERLSDLADDPVRINSAPEEELSRLFFLTDFQVKALEDYSHSSGRIFSVYELANIPGFDRPTVEMMIPFISLEQPVSQPASKTSFSNSLLTNVIYKTGSHDTSDLGSPVRLLTRYRFSVSGFSGGITAEKDPGERLLSGNPEKPDFLSAYLSYKGKGFIKKILIGDFSARFGQGTGINTGSAAFLSLTAPSFMSARSEIRPYTSTDENNFFRGATIELGVKNLGVTMYYSENKIDATIDTATSEITGFYTSGLHNTSALFLKKDVLSDKSYGLNIKYDFRNFSAGLVARSDRLSIPLAANDNDPGKIYSFSGDRNDVISAYYNALINKFLLFGEMSVNGHSGKAFIQGISMKLSDRFTVNGLIRKYEPQYFSIHGRGPGGGPGNESSINANFTLEAARHLFIYGGCELKQFPWLRYRCSSPSSSSRQEVRIRYLPSENITIEGLYNFRMSMNDDQESTGVPLLKETNTDYLRTSVRYSVAENFTVSARLDYKSVRKEGEQGYMMLEDISYKFHKLPLTLWARYCLFRTDSWDARLYAYENDLLYSFSIPSLSGTGSRSYLMLKYEIGSTAEIRLKYGQTFVLDKKEERDLRVQIRVLF